MDKEALADLYDLTGRVAIVTGGTRGIGRAIAEGLVCAGAKVVVASRKSDACVETQSHLESLGGEALGAPVHMGDPEGIDELVDLTVQRFGGLDIVVNNAANALAQPVGEFTLDAWAKSVDTNLRGPVFLVQKAIPHLEASGHGAVVNVISAGAFLFSSGQAMYSAGKAGLMAMTRAQSAALATRGIRVNALAPGTVDTDMVRNVGPEIADAMGRACQLRRAASPDEMVGPALLLVSDAGSYMTGQCLIVDGGLAPH